MSTDISGRRQPCTVDPEEVGKTGARTLLLIGIRSYFKFYLFLETIYPNFVKDQDFLYPRQML